MKLNNIQLTSRLAPLVKSSNQILNKLSLDKVIVFLSGGKDSTALCSIMAQSGINCVYLYKYLVPNMSFDEKVLVELENRFSIKIHRIENPVRTGMYKSDTFRIKHIWDAQDALIGQGMKNQKYDRWIRETFKGDWFAMGLKKSDTLQRYMALTKHPNPNPNQMKVYPLAEWKDRDIWDYLKINKLPINESYSAMKRSLSILNINHVYPMKLSFPEDYKRVTKDFPLLEGLIWLYEKRAKKYGIVNLPQC